MSRIREKGVHLIPSWKPYDGKLALQCLPIATNISMWCYFIISYVSIDAAAAKFNSVIVYNVP